MSSQTTFEATPNATSSQASAAGASLFDLPDDAMTNPSGQGPVRASPSPSKGNKRASMTHGTSGLNSTASSQESDLQLSLESRLRHRLTGSMLCEVTWEKWNTPWGQLLSRPRARVRSLFATAFGLWLTPRARGDGGGRRWRRGVVKNLEDQARLFALSQGLSEDEAARLSVSPTFYATLMGYPAAWLSCAPSATRSSRKSQPSSSKPTTT